MNNSKSNYDVASISRPGEDKRTNHVRNALQYDHAKVSKPGQFVKVFADMFLSKGLGNKRII